MTARHFVFLQGMPSPFFHGIGKELAARGHAVTGVALCWGDAHFWRGGETVKYRGSLSRWPAFIGGLFDRERATDLVLLGEQRRYHKEAIAEAKKRNIRIAVTDFGYLRPDWVTLERDGMGGNSLFPKEMREIIRLAEGVPAPDANGHYSDSFWAMARGDLLYSFGNLAFFWLYPGYRRSDVRTHPFLYFPAMGIRLWSARHRNQVAASCLERLLTSGARYYLFPMQLEHDFQIVAYSSFSGMEEPLHRVITSFARHAAPNTRLVVRPHPWDPGFHNWKKRTACLAEKDGVSDRIDFLDGGTLDPVATGAAGVVTVNSTSGLRALQLGKPVKTLGQAVYDLDGLTFRGDLDAFWTDAEAPPAENVDAFVRALAATTQIRGVFFSEPGLGAAVNAAADRLDAGTVGQRADR